VRQSNFSPYVLDANLAPRSRNHPILIVNTENDFAICVKESREAIEWYTKNDYQDLYWLKIKGLGHERTPDMAADFFARAAGVEPLKPPTVVMHRQVIDGNAAGLAMLAGAAPDLSQPVRTARANKTPALSPRPQPTPTPTRLNSARSEIVNSSPPTPHRAMSVSRATHPRAGSEGDGVHVTQVSAMHQQSPAGSKPATPPRAREVVDDPARNVTIRVSSAIGIEPLHLGFSVDCPPEWAANADVLWTVNGNAVCSGVNGQKTLAEPGVYELGVVIVTADGQEHRAKRSVRVLPRITETAARGK
jgi:hypothetical protein